MAKILFITHENFEQKDGGLGTFSYEFVTEMRKAGHRISTVLNNYFPKIQPSKWHELVLNPTPEGKREHFAELNKLNNHMQKFRPDIIITNDRQNFNPFFYVTPNAPLVFAIHLPYPDMLGAGRWDKAMWKEFKIERKAAQMSNQVWVFSKFMKERMPSYLDVPDSKVVHAPIGTNISARLFQKHRPELKVVSYFGRIEEYQKRISLFSSVAKAMAKEGIEFRLYGKRLKGSEDIILSGVIKQKGFKKGLELEKAYLESDVVIMPSNYEPFGFVGLEALAHGCQLIAPQGLGMDDYEGGLISPKKFNTETVVSLLRKWRADWPSYSNTASRLTRREWLSKRFDWSAVIPQYDHLISDLMNGFHH
mgnify:CR=1 FL=1